MSEVFSGPLPKSLDEIDAAFMTRVLRHNKVISASNEVVAQEEEGVGMTAGYFSAIKKVKCRYKEATDAPTSFVVKTWPPFEILPSKAGDLVSGLRFLKPAGLQPDNKPHSACSILEVISRLSDSLPRKSSCGSRI